MHFDATITLGNILATISIVSGMWFAAWRAVASIDKRFVALQNALERHEQRIDAHDKKIDRQDEMLMNIVLKLERLIGRLEANSDTIQRAERAS